MLGLLQPLVVPFLKWLGSRDLHGIPPRSDVQVLSISNTTRLIQQTKPFVRSMFVWINVARRVSGALRQREGGGGQKTLSLRSGRDPQQILRENLRYGL